MDTMQNQISLNNPEFYINRELSWLAFNSRVLEEAADKTNPLLERFRFLAITASNLDEFFMVRVSVLEAQIASGITTKDATGMTPAQQLKTVAKAADAMMVKQYNCLNRSLLPTLEKEGISFLNYADLDEKQKIFAERYFHSMVFPVLTPMAIDASRPFPIINTKTLNIFAEIRQDDKTYNAVVQVPTILPRVIKLSERKFILLEELVREHLGSLFPGYWVKNAALFRITRNSDIGFEEDADDLMLEIERSIKKRKRGAPVRLEIEKSASKSAKKYLKTALKLGDEFVFEINGPLDLTVWMGFAGKFSGVPGFEHLLNEPLPPVPPVDFLDKDIFDVVRSKDVLIQHPYEDFGSVVQFIRQAAADPSVLAIKQTLYRVSGQSPIVKALMDAAENGKQVTVLVELKARFDEENNIQWAKRMDQAGCHVIYGLSGLKTHCKVCLVVRREDDGIRRYVHLGTGNYNDSTARIYTDFGYFTCKESFGQDASALFNILTGYSSAGTWNKIAVAPATLRGVFMRNIENETRNAQAGKPARIIAKMNSLVDIGIIQALYRASMAGVKVQLLVRGICCLKVGIPGVSENITVASIVDRFLEHSRIYYFENEGNPVIYLSSADWMPRNLDRRVEIAFPIEDENLRAELIKTLEIHFSDTAKLREQLPGGDYEKLDRRGKEYVRSQLVFHELAEARYKEAVGKAEKEALDLFKGEI